MKIERFEDIIAWQKGHELTVLAFKYLQNNKDFTFRNQFFGALYSITNNIAEGFERRSNKEFR
jgi:four helix bundle protein